MVKAPVFDTVYYWFDPNHSCLFLKMNRFQIFILAALIVIFSFLEIIVFDEEVLLALCFVSFIFFAYSYLNLSIYELFEDRSNKFETDLLIAFEGKYSQMLILSKSFSLDKSLSKKISIVSKLEKASLKTLKASLLMKLNAHINNLVTTLLNDTLTIEKKIAFEVQQNKIERVIYPFIYSSNANYVLSKLYNITLDTKKL